MSFPDPVPSITRALATPEHLARLWCLLLPWVLGIAACGAPPEPQSAPLLEEASRAPSVYARVAPGVAYVDTPISSGSGLLIGPERVVTNAHVVWPETHVRLVFPDGSEIERAPVIVRDALRDLALIEAPGVGLDGGSPSPLTLGDARDAPIGSQVFLVGYPAETAPYPQPAISGGILSLRRSWPAGALDYLQTDAAIAGGQSGGALVDEQGRVLGISGLIFGEGGFALAADAMAALGHLSRVAAGDDPEAASTWRPLTDTAEASSMQRLSLSLEGPFAEKSLVLHAAFSDEITVRAEPGPEADLFLELLSPHGDLDIDADERGAGGEEEGVATALAGGPHVVVLGRLDGNLGPTSVLLEASHGLRQLDDPDDGMLLRPGQRIVGALDHPGDIDRFELVVPGGHERTVTVDTVNFVPDLLLEAVEGTVETPLIPGATGEGNALGLASRATLSEGSAGRWSIRVADLDGAAQGGYVLSVE